MLTLDRQRITPFLDDDAHADLQPRVEAAHRAVLDGSGAGGDMLGWRDLLLDLIPRYRQQGKAYVHVAFGCTGGRHRSVFTAERMARDLRDQGFSPTVRHRNLGSRATDELERKRP